MSTKMIKKILMHVFSNWNNYYLITLVIISILTNIFLLSKIFLKKIFKAESRICFVYFFQKFIFVFMPDDDLRINV